MEAIPFILYSLSRTRHGPSFSTGVLRRPVARRLRRSLRAILDQPSRMENAAPREMIHPARPFSAAAGPAPLPPASPSSKIKDKSFPETGTPGMLRPWLPRAVMPALDAVIHAAGSPREREVLYNVAAWMAGARPATPIKGDDADPNSGRRFQKNRFPNFLRLNVLIFHDMAGNSFGKIWRREIRLLRNPLI